MTTKAKPIAFLRGRPEGRITEYVLAQLQGKTPVPVDEPLPEADIPTCFPGIVIKSDATRPTRASNPNQAADRILRHLEPHLAPLPIGHHKQAFARIIEKSRMQTPQNFERLAGQLLKQMEPMVAPLPLDRYQKGIEHVLASTEKITFEKTVRCTNPKLQMAAQQAVSIMKTGTPTATAINGILQEPGLILNRTELEFAAGLELCLHKYGQAYAEKLRKPFVSRAENTQRLLHKIMAGENLHPWAHEVYGTRENPHCPLEIGAEAAYLAEYGNPVDKDAAQELIQTFSAAKELAASWCISQGIPLENVEP